MILKLISKKLNTNSLLLYIYLNSNILEKDTSLPRKSKYIYKWTKNISWKIELIKVHIYNVKHTKQIRFLFLLLITLITL